MHYLLIVILPKICFKNRRDAGGKVDVWLRGVTVFNVVGGKSRGRECREASVGKVSVKDVFDRRMLKLSLVSEWFVQSQLGKCPVVKRRIVFRWSSGCTRPCPNDDIASSPTVLCGRGNWGKTAISETLTICTVQVCLRWLTSNNLQY